MLPPLRNFLSNGYARFRNTTSMGEIASPPDRHSVKMSCESEEWVLDLTRYTRPSFTFAALEGQLSLPG